MCVARWVGTMDRCCVVDRMGVFVARQLNESSCGTQTAPDKFERVGVSQVVEHIESWNVSGAQALAQMLRPGRRD